MTKEEMIERLEEIVKALKDENTDVDTEALEEEARSLRTKLDELNKVENRKTLADKINNDIVEVRKVNEEETRKTEIADIEKKANALKEKRSITVSSRKRN